MLRLYIKNLLFNVQKIISDLLGASNYSTLCERSQISKHTLWRPTSVIFGILD